jgi:hypothetical protein
VELDGANCCGVNGQGRCAFYRVGEVMQGRGGGRSVKWRLTPTVLMLKGVGEEGRR